MSENKAQLPEIIPPEIEEVMDDCIRLFVLHGYETSSMEDLYAVCGSHRAVIEKTFSSKQQFCSAALRWWLNRAFTELKSVVTLHSNLYPATEAVLYEFIEYSVGQRELQKAAHFHILEEIVVFDEHLNGKLFEYYQEGVKHFSFKFFELKHELKDPASAEVLIAYYVMVMEGLYTYVRRGMPKEALFAFADMSLHTLNAHLKDAAKQTDGF